jgi:hypothetical protein
MMDNTFEKVLTTALFASRVVTENMISSNFNIKVIAFFPGFLDQPCSNIILAHIIN